MTIEEKYSQLIEELFDGIDRGDFNNIGTVPSTYTFQYLEAMAYYARRLDGGVDLYQQLHEIVSNVGKKALQDKIKSKKKIKITFLAISAAEWPVDELYRLFMEDERFDVYVTNCPLVDRDKSNRDRTYLQNKDFFESRGYRTLSVYDVETEKIYSWQDLGEVPDIVIHLSYWYASMPPCFRISNYPFKVLNFHIAYGFETGDSANGTYITQISCNNPLSNLVCTNYVNSLIDLKGLQKNQLLKGTNAKYSGYSKMDFFYKQREYSDAELRNIWRTPSEKNPKEMKKIIIAPHHSFLGYAGIMFSTFAENFNFWLYLAEKYQDEILFAFKPHPNLRYRAVEAKIFKDESDYDAYVKRWLNLPNATVVDETSYLDLFATSDAMIMDSISFIAEYLYTQKPLLFLTREEQKCSELGEKCMRAYDKAPGADYVKIEKFITDVVLAGRDTQKQVRREVFDEVLDYQKMNSCSASQFIYADICKSIE